MFKCSVIILDTIPMGVQDVNSKEGHTIGVIFV